MAANVKETLDSDQDDQYSKEYLKEMYRVFREHKKSENSSSKSEPSETSTGREINYEEVRKQWKPWVANCGYLMLLLLALGIITTQRIILYNNLFRNTGFV